MPNSGPNRRHRTNETHMTTKKRNTPKKAAAKPRRAPRRTKAETIAETISRKLDDLLDGRVPYSATAVGAWTATPQDDRIVASYAQAEPASERRSAIDEAIGRLFSAIGSAECVTDSLVQRLEPIAAPQPPSNPAPGAAALPTGASVLSAQLHEIADRIYADSRRRLDLLNRLEL